MKEWTAATVLETDTRDRYPVSFITPRRAQQELEYGAMAHTPDLLVVANTDLETMTHAARDAWRQGFFESVVPLDSANGTC